MGYNFPSSPAPGDVFAPSGGPVWRWNGYGWEQLSTGEFVPEAPVDGTPYERQDAEWVPASGGGGGGVTDGDKGDIVVSGTGATWLFDPTVVTPAAKTVLDDASTAAMLTTLGGLPSSSYTAADVLAKLITVDGAGSLLDADLLDGQSSAFYATAASVSGKENSIAAGTTAQYWRGDKSWQTLDKAAVGLGNVDNTSDANKPVSTAQQTAIDGRVADTGDTMTGDLTIAKTTPALNVVKGASGEEGVINFKTGANMRWKVASNTTAESANAGSDFAVSRYNDAGTLVDAPLTVRRTDGRLITKDIQTVGFIQVNGPSAGNLYIDKVAGNEGALNLRTGVVNRWRIYSDSAAESADNGSHFRISRHNDAGTSLGDSLVINRSTGAVTFGGALGTTGTIAGTGSVFANNGTAPPAGGTTAVCLKATSTANFGVFFGSGVPTLSAAQGSIYLRSDGTGTNSRVYVNTNGTTGWAAMSVIAVGTSAPSSPATNDVWIDTT